MKQNNAMDEDLLVKYLVNETDEGETTAVEKWIGASTENKKQFEQFLLIWEQGLQLTAATAVNPDDAWLRLQQRIEKSGRQKRVPPVKLLTKNWARVAATLLVAAIAGWLGYVFVSNKDEYRIKPVTIASAHSVVTDTLPDLSIVTLNKNATLSYVSKFRGPARDVTLNGEAFFKVTPDKTKPFIIHVNDVTVRVVGTSFNIKSSRGKTEVIVETGVVQVTKNKHTVQLLPKEKIVTRWQDSALLKDTIADELYSYYRSKTFVCSHTPLQSLVQTLNDAYNANIIIGNEALKNLPITAVFKEESLDNILAVIKETFKIKIDKTGNQIILH